MAFTMYSYLNETTGDLVISGQEESLGEGYTQLSTPPRNPTKYSEWPWDSVHTSIKTVHVGTISPIDVTSTTSMFNGCLNLTSLDLSSFDTSQVTDMSYMFYVCSILTSLDLSSFDTSKVTDMTAMFRSCRSLKSLDLSSFDTSNVTSMNDMFNNCSILTSLDLSNFDTSHVTDMEDMFYYCPLLQIIDIPTTATSIVSELPEDTYYDVITGTPYSKADIPGGSTYVDDESYVTSPAGIIHTRQGMLAMSRTINNRISSLQNHRRILESEMSGDRVYVVDSADAKQSVTGETIVAPCLLIVNGDSGTSMTYRR